MAIYMALYSQSRAIIIPQRNLYSFMVITPQLQATTNLISVSLGLPVLRHFM